MYKKWPQIGHVVVFEKENKMDKINDNQKNYKATLTGNQTELEI